ncbi:MAG: hypothetical protein EOO46_18920 [Flavobacterium sp.]|nr:MAG: hypothetical protein EOO46_18920 [Flavobacterium sp.]
MIEFLTGKELDNKLTDIIWEAKKELIIVSPFIWLDDYCKDIFKKKFKNAPEVEVIIVFGKNEGETQRSLKPQDLSLFKEFSNITIIYCKDLHAKYYANEKEALLTSLNLLGKSMTGNIEYGVAFENGTLNSKLYDDSISFTNNLITTHPCIYVKRPVFKKTNLGLTKKYVESVVLLDHTDAIYANRSFKNSLYNEFTNELFENEIKPTRQDFVAEPKAVAYRTNDRWNQTPQEGYCIRSGVKIPFNPKKPLSYLAYQTWAQYGDHNFPEKYCHLTGKRSNGNTSVGNPIL